MQDQNKFTIAAPIEKVLTSHRSSRNLKAITPPFFFMIGIRASDQLSDDGKLASTQWMSPFPCDGKLV
jgi:ligand-binding SRPBCC domain-containing protein